MNNYVFRWRMFDFLTLNLYACISYGNTTKLQLTPRVLLENYSFFKYLKLLFLCLTRYFYCTYTFSWYFCINYNFFDKLLKRFPVMYFIKRFRYFLLNVSKVLLNERPISRAARFKKNEHYSLHTFLISYTTLCMH